MEKDEKQQTVSPLEKAPDNTPAEEQKTERYNQLLLDNIAGPAMLIRHDRTIVAANRFAREMGAGIGDYCWRSFGHGKYIPEPDKRFINEHPGCIPSGGTKCVFCLDVHGKTWASGGCRLRAKSVFIIGDKAKKVSAAGGDNEFHHSELIGSSIMKVAPLPSSLSAYIRPPCAPTTP